MRKKYDKQDIIEKGSILVRQRGYHNTGINDILKEVGIPRGSFYNFFESKEQFGEEILTYYGESQREWIKTRFAEKDGSALEKILHFYTKVSSSNEGEDYRFGCLVNNLSTEVGGLVDPLAEVSNRQFEGWLEEISSIMAKGQKDGSIRSDIPATELADFVHTSFHGSQSRMKMQRSGVSIERFLKMIKTFLTP
ncbi:MAG: TetR/AcrR family transcriptional regulator [Bacteroidota bacterium]